MVLLRNILNRFRLAWRIIEISSTRRLSILFDAVSGNVDVVDSVFEFGGHFQPMLLQWLLNLGFVFEKYLLFDLISEQLAVEHEFETMLINTESLHSLNWGVKELRAFVVDA